MTDLSNVTALSILQDPNNIVDYVVEFTLDNVGGGEWPNHDWLGGKTPPGGSVKTYAELDNKLSFANRTPLNPQTKIYANVVKDFAYGQSISFPFAGGITSSEVAALRISQWGNHIIPGIFDRHWKAATFSLSVGGLLNKGLHNEKRLKHSEYPVFMTGRVTNHSRVESEYVLALSNDIEAFNKPFPPNTYQGTGGKEGDAEVKGETKPLAWGFPKNVKPVQIGERIYQWHDGQIGFTHELAEKDDYIQAARDAIRGDLVSDGVVLDASLDTLTVPDGRYVFDNKGIIQVGSDVEDLTIDCAGGAETYGLEKVIPEPLATRGNSISVALRILEDYAGISNVEVDDNVYASPAYPVIGSLYGEEICGWYLDKPTTVGAFISFWLDSMGYVLLRNISSNTLLIKRRELPTSENVSGVISEVIVGSEREIGNVPAYSHYNVRYGRVFHVQRRAELPAQRRRIDSKEWQIVSAKNSRVLAEQRSSQALTIDTPVIASNADNAENLAQWVNAYGIGGKLWECTVPNVQHKYVPTDVVTMNVDSMPAGNAVVMAARYPDLPGKLTQLQVAYYG